MFDGCRLQDETGFKHARAIGTCITQYSLTNRFRGETEHCHRPMSAYLNAAAKHSFCLLLFFFAEYRKV